MIAPSSTPYYLLLHLSPTAKPQSCNRRFLVAVNQQSFMMTRSTNEASSKELWRHSNPHTTQIFDFIQTSNAKHGLSMTSYNDLWQWSVSEPANFWEDVWNYTAVRAHKPYDRVSELVLLIPLATERPLSASVFCLFQDS